ncbi:MAG: glycosyltransferase [Acidobacteriota bacterium]|nr:glycosyltransferase [Acidobacteriota bacterium]
MEFLKRLLRALPLLLLSPFLLLAAVVGIATLDLLWRIRGRRIQPESSMPSTASATVVIPNWNGRDLLAKYLPSVTEAMAGNPSNEILVVDNGSHDGSAEFVRQNFPLVRVLGLERNLGFGGGSNAGFRAAKNDIVVLLNSDMRVDPGFLAPLLQGFTDPQVFAVSCQIFLSDPNKRREETGLTEGWWQDGALRVSHREDPEVDALFPCFYGGGGSCAFDRKKFLDLGGFDELFAPFYLEDTDLGYLAWKRGWKVLYQPASIVYHEHRGTIGKTFRNAYIQNVLKKNFILFCWKNIHEWRRLGNHFLFTFLGSLLSVAFGEEPGRATLGGFARAVLHLRAALKSRWRAHRLASVSDTEAFERPRGGHFRDRFNTPSVTPERPAVLFVSPYPVCPPTHGGGVFMHSTLRELAKLTEVHALVMLDYEHQRAANEELKRICASAALFVRGGAQEPNLGSTIPNAVYEFGNRDVAWLIDRLIFQKQVDVVQLEYTALGQYAERYRRIACILFEHDIYFQSVARGLQFTKGTLDRVKARWEYLRAIRYELRMLPPLDGIQVCTRENREYLEGFLPTLNGRVQEGLRAGIATAEYPYPGGPRQPFTMLFLGSFRHVPNQVALEWFTRLVLPRIVERCPQAKLLVAGSDPLPRHAYHDPLRALEMLGFVDDIGALLAQAAVFVCPIQSGSGVRVKLLEAFASGIPVVSTYIGAEGLARRDGEFCYLSDDPADFAAKVLQLFADPSGGAAIAERARAEVAAYWDMQTITARLLKSYRSILTQKRGSPN